MKKFINNVKESVTMEKVENVLKIFTLLLIICVASALAISYFSDKAAEGFKTRVKVTDKYETNFVDFYDNPEDGLLYPQFHSCCHIITEVGGFTVSTETYDRYQVGDYVYLDKVDVYDGDKLIKSEYHWTQGENSEAEEYGGTLDDFRESLGMQYDDYYVDLNEEFGEVDEL